MYYESAGELVGTDVVTSERAADDVRGMLRMLRESIGEKSSHKTMVATKRSLQTLLLLSLVHSIDALSLTCPISFSVLEQLQVHGILWVDCHATTSQHVGRTRARRHVWQCCSLF